MNGYRREFKVNTYTMSAQSDPSIAEDDRELRGGLGQQRAGWLLAGCLRPALRRAFERIGGEFRVNSYTTGARPAGRGLGRRRVLGRRVGQAAPGQDGNGGGIFAQQYAPDLIFDNNFETGGLRPGPRAATTAAT